MSPTACRERGGGYRLAPRKSAGEVTVSTRAPITQTASKATASRRTQLPIRRTRELGPVGTISPASPAMITVIKISRSTLEPVFSSRRRNGMSRAEVQWSCPVRAFLAALLIFMAPSPAFAWGQTGHRITGAIAEPLLTRKAARAIRAIIGTETLAEASTWADEMRSNPDLFWQSTANPWHYVTIPQGKSYADVGAPEEGDAVTALRKFRETLKDPKATLADKQLALRFTVHIIGDLHQPLHAGNGTDKGGNDVRVTLFREQTNLHSVWDSGLIDRRQLSFTEYASFLQRRITSVEKREWATPDLRVWIAESAAIRDTIYPTGDQLSWDYAYKSNPIIDRRLAQGGVRMATYLNDLFR